METITVDHSFNSMLAKFMSSERHTDRTYWGKVTSKGNKLFLASFSKRGGVPLTLLE